MFFNNVFFNNLYHVIYYVFLIFDDKYRVLPVMTCVQIIHRCKLVSALLVRLEWQIATVDCN